MKHMVEKRVALAFFLALCLLALARFLAYQNSVSYISSSERSSGTLSTLLALHAARDDLNQAETAQRAYLRTGDQQFSDSFDDLKVDLPKQLAKLRRLERDDLYSLEQLADLERYAAQKLAVMSEAVELRRQGQTAQANERLKLPVAHNSMTQVQRILQEVERHENQELAAQDAERSHAQRRATITAVIIALIDIAILTVGFLALNRYARARRRAEQSLLATAELQQAIFDAADYSIISCNPDGTIRSFNRAAERWLGYSAEEMVGRCTPREFHDPEEMAQRA